MPTGTFHCTGAKKGAGAHEWVVEALCARPPKDDGHKVPGEGSQRQHLPQQAQHVLQGGVEAMYEEKGVVACSCAGLDALGVGPRCTATPHMLTMST